MSESKSRETLLKSPLDVMLSSVMIILSLPVSLPIVFGMKMEDRGPIFYRQERWRGGGARFRAYEFRTMVENSDQEKALDPGRERLPISAQGWFG